MLSSPPSCMAIILLRVGASNLFAIRMIQSCNSSSSISLFPSLSSALHNCAADRSAVDLQTCLWSTTERCRSNSMARTSFASMCPFSSSSYWRKINFAVSARPGLSTILCALLILLLSCFLCCLSVSLFWLLCCIVEEVVVWSDCKLSLAFAI